jgi:predicted DCC family thiol-disulfide oxidoreductase YuxK
MEQTLSKPVLLFNDECSICRMISGWVRRSAESRAGGSSIIVRPIGVDPLFLRTLNPELDIWDAYANIHLLMPDGSMKINGEAVAETLRNLPSTSWFSASFNWRIFGRRPLR